MLQYFVLNNIKLCLYDSEKRFRNGHTAPPIFVIERIDGNGRRTLGVVLGVAVDSLKSAMPLLGSCSRSAILASARPVGSMKPNAIR